MFSLLTNILTVNPSKHPAALALVSKDTIGSKTSIFVKFKLFFSSLNKIVPILFVSLLFAGCGGSSNGTNNGTTPNTPTIPTTINASTPAITTQPQSANYTQGDTPKTLNIMASVTDGGNLTYQWYGNGTAISGATATSYTPPTSSVGTTNYHVVVTNTNSNVNGSKTATVTSNTATIIVTLPKYTVKCFDNNLDLLKEAKVEKGEITPSDICDTGTWYLTEGAEVAQHTLDGDANFYKSANVVEISDQEELSNIRSGLSGAYILMNDIVLESDGAGFDAQGWQPIGKHYDGDINKFRGVLNGNGYVISGLWINKDAVVHIFDSHYRGLFGSIKNGAVKNLGVKTANDGVQGHLNVGIIAGAIESSTITDSYTEGNVSGESNIGGIVGSVNANAKIMRSYSSANAIGEKMSVGGIAGYAIDAAGEGLAWIIDSYAIGNVTGSKWVGGIAGDAYSYAIITNCYATGNIIGIEESIGGIVGRVHSVSNITNSAALNPLVKGYNANRIVGGTTSTGNKISNNFALNTMDIVMTTNDVYTGGNSGTSKDTTELQTQSTYENATNADGSGGLGWAFDGDNATAPWKMDADKNGGYPYLYWQKL
ncbi:MAG: hypothetical protein LBQ18_00685 [Campylobacteraceae bacterium]|jgi:hypothetical protein|nr:hypothetical protein [Campylobacteraceae bacterium]